MILKSVSYSLILLTNEEKQAYFYSNLLESLQNEISMTEQSVEMTEDISFVNNSQFKPKQR